MKNFLIAVLMLTAFTCQAGEYFDADESLQDAGIGIYAPDHKESINITVVDDGSETQLPDHIYKDGELECYRIGNDLHCK